MPGVTQDTDADTGLPVLNKYAYDTTTVTLDMSRRIARGATITSIAQASARALGRIDSSAALTVTNPISTTGNKVVVTVAGGTAGEAYLIDVRIETSASERLEGRFVLAVE